MDNKKIARYALNFIGGTPKVERYYNLDESKQIDIMTCTNGFCEGIDTLSTIGLNNIDIGLKSKDQKLRVEILIVGNLNNMIIGNILSSIAFEIMDLHRCMHGMIIPNAISEYISDVEVKHIVLLSPVFWNKYKPLTVDDITIVWLLAIPISDTEVSFISTKGIDAFDRLLEECNVDVLNYSRISIV